MKYTVNVGNIGNIGFTNKKEATEAYNEYVNQSKTNYGRAAGETVILLKGDEILKEHTGTIDSEEETESKKIIIEVQGDTLADILNGIDEARKLIEAGNLTGYNQNDTGNFTFEYWNEEAD